MKKFFLIIVFFLILKIVFPVHELWWDESVYIGMGKYIYSLGKIGIWEPIRPIGLPIILGLLWKIGNILVLSKILAILFSISYLYMTYLISKKLFDEKTALIASILIVLTPIFFYFSSHSLTDIPAGLLSLIAVNYYLKKDYLKTGLFSGLSFLFKFPQGLLLLIFLFLAKGLRKKTKCLLGFSAVVLPYLLFNLVIYGNPFSPIISASLHQSNNFYAVQGDSLFYIFYNLFYYIINLMLQNPIYLFFVVGMINSKKLPVLISVIFIVYFTIIINKQIRFALGFLPFIAMISANFVKRYPVLLLIGLIALPSIYYENITVKDSPEIYTKIPSGITILTSTPLPAAYVDSYFIPFYESVDAASDDYDRYKGEEYVFYASEFYPCKTESCNVRKQLLFETILENRTIVYHERTYEDLYLLKKDN